MQWGEEQSVGHYVDLGSEILALTSVYQSATYSMHWRTRSTRLRSLICEPYLLVGQDVPYLAPLTSANREKSESVIASERLYPIRRPLAALSAGAAVAILGGLIGLGGAEFRLPILIAVFARTGDPPFGRTPWR